MQDIVVSTAVTDITAILKADMDHDVLVFLAPVMTTSTPTPSETVIGMFQGRI